MVQTFYYLRSSRVRKIYFWKCHTNNNSAVVASTTSTTESCAATARYQVGNVEHMCAGMRRRRRRAKWTKRQSGNGRISPMCAFFQYLFMRVFARYGDTVCIKIVNTSTCVWLASVLFICAAESVNFQKEYATKGDAVNKLDLHWCCVYCVNKYLLNVGAGSQLQRETNLTFHGHY